MNHTPDELELAVDRLKEDASRPDFSARVYVSKADLRLCLAILKANHISGERG